MEQGGIWRMSVAMGLSGTIVLFVVMIGQPALTVVFFRCLIVAVALLAWLYSNGAWRVINCRALAWLIVGPIALILNWLRLFSAYPLSNILSGSAFEQINVKYLLILFTTMLFSTSLLAADNWLLSSAGYGLVQTGMTVKQAESVFGSTLVVSSEGPPGSACKFMVPSKGHAGVSMMVQNGRIAHIETASPGVVTKSGVRVGDSSDKVKNLYGKKLEIEIHKYDEKSFSYFVWNASGNSGLKFEISNDKVDTIYAGSKSIRLVEGCN
jgi:hypothetical protein